MINFVDEGHSIFIHTVEMRLRYFVAVAAKVDFHISNVIFDEDRDPLTSTCCISGILV